MTSPPTERQRFQERFWNDKARENAHFHILGDHDILDAEKRDGVFEKAGIEDGRKLSVYVHPESSVVDLGCGIGRVMRRLAPLCRTVIGCDVSEEMLQRGEDYLAGLDNARLLHTDGASLAGIEDRSVDFFYSLLCLIHVEKRSAWRYLEEISRILRPEALCFLQVHDMMTEEGFEKFRSVTRSDYPLEFYTEDEIRFLLARAGLETLLVEHTGEFMNVIAVSGSASRWRDTFANDITVTPEQVSGFYADEEISARDRGVIDLRIENRGTSWRGFRFVTRLDLIEDDQVAGCLHEFQATLQVAPGEDVRLQVHKPEGDLDPRICCEGGRSVVTLPHGRVQPLPSSARIARHLALMPTGFDWTPDTVQLFPGSCSCELVAWPG